MILWLFVILSRGCNDIMIVCNFDFDDEDDCCCWCFVNGKLLWFEVKVKLLV